MILLTLSQKQINGKGHFYKFPFEQQEVFAVIF